MPSEQEIVTFLDALFGIRILLDIQMSNGLHIQRGNLGYDGLKRLVEQLGLYVDYKWFTLFLLFAWFS